MKHEGVDKDADALADHGYGIAYGLSQYKRTNDYSWLSVAQNGARTVPIFPALRRRLLVAWKVRSSENSRRRCRRCTATGSVVAGTDLRRVIREAKRAAGLEEVEGRLSLHALRHSMLSIAATDMGLAATTLASIAGHAAPATTFRLYARDARDEGTMVADVLERAAGAGVGS